MHTRQHGHSGPRNLNSNQIHNMSLCTSRQKNCMRHCTSQFHISSRVLYICGSFHIFAILCSATGSPKEVQYPQTHAVYSSIYFNKLFRVADALLFVLVLIIKFKLYIKLNHLFKSPINIITFIIPIHIFKLHNQFTFRPNTHLK